MLKVAKDLMVPIRWMDGHEREKGVVDAFRHSSMTTILMKRRSDERSDRNYSMADDQINDVKRTFITIFPIRAPNHQFLLILGMICQHCIV